MVNLVNPVDILPDVPSDINRGLPVDINLGRRAEFSLDRQAEANLGQRVEAELGPRVGAGPYHQPGNSPCDRSEVKNDRTRMDPKVYRRVNPMNHQIILRVNHEARQLRRKTTLIRSTINRNQIQSRS